MTFDSLQDFIAELDRAGELVRIAHPVQAKLELCEIADRVMKQPGGGKALLFDHVIRDDGSRLGRAQERQREALVRRAIEQKFVTPSAL